MRRMEPHACSGLDRREWLALVLKATLVGAGGCASATAPSGGDPDPYDHRLAPGVSARDFLTAVDFDRLVVQVQYVSGFRPSDVGLQHLQDFLTARVNKPGGIALQLDAPLQIQGQSTYSTADVRALEQTHRTRFTEGTTLAAYLLFLDGEYSPEPNVLGIAYNNTSMAVFVEKIGQYTGGLGQPPPSTVEGAVANHEFGHILGLVANGSPMQTPHQDVANGSHCDDQSCLMYYAVRTTDFISNLLGGVPSLNAACVADLQGNGGK